MRHDILKYQAVPAGEFKNLVNQGLPLIDLRMSFEFNADHIPGAKNISFTMQSMDWLAEIKKLLAREEQILCYCASNGRVEQMIKLLEADKATGKIIALAGGFMSWQKSN